MEDLRESRHPTIIYRPIRPTDLEILEKLHCDLFPIRYESEFFHNVVNGRNIVSWGVVDRSRHAGQSDELIGFVTARLVLAKDSEVDDLLRFDPSRSDQTLVYILTLGVVDSYRNFGIATSLIQEVIKYAANVRTCRAVYLHVISYNNPAIHLYKKMCFQCVRRLHSFYFINGRHYDSYLFIYYINGGRSPCSPLELATVLVAYMRSGFKTVIGRLWRNGERKVPKWLKCKQNNCLLPTTTTQNKRIITSEST
jgi:ribosomal protein S18 acetylase RimI-like enzyme